MKSLVTRNGRVTLPAFSGTYSWPARSPHLLTIREEAKTTYAKTVRCIYAYADELTPEIQALTYTYTHTHTHTCTQNTHTPPPPHTHTPTQPYTYIHIYTKNPVNTRSPSLPPPPPSPRTKQGGGVVSEHSYIAIMRVPMFLFFFSSSFSSQPNQYSHKKPKGPLHQKVSDSFTF